MIGRRAFLAGTGAVAALPAFAQAPSWRDVLARASGKPAIIHCLIDPEAITPARSLSDIRRAALAK